MIKRLPLLFTLLSLLFINACKKTQVCDSHLQPGQVCGFKKRPHKKIVHGEYLHPIRNSHGATGSYAFEGDGGVWWYYTFDAERSPNPVTLPSGGSWARGNEPKAEDIEEAEEVEIDESGVTGWPETDSQFEAENQSVETENSTDSDSSSESTSGSDSSGDSGASDGGGGDGGSSD